MQSVLNHIFNCLILIFFISGPAQLCSGGELNEQKTFPPLNPSAVFSPDIFQHADVNSLQTEVMVADDVVSVDLNESPIRIVLQEISEQSGIKVRISRQMVSFNVTDQFSALSIEKALYRLLNGTSYALVYGNNNGKESVTGVYVLASGKPFENTPGKEIVTDTSQQDLIEALDHISLPDNIKEALRDGAKDNTAALRKSLADHKMGALSRLLENLESFGAADSETTHQLRKQLLLHQSQQR